MRRFSSKNNLVTLNEINITPLLDLAFVLLIIFVITTPSLEQSLQMTVPAGGSANSTVSKADVVTVEVSQNSYRMAGATYNLQQLEQMLAAEARKRPDVPIYIRADEAEQYKNVIALLDSCERLGIKRVKFATRPVKRS